MTKETSNAFYALKGLAIISVAIAHSPFQDADLGRLATILGTIGVPIFFIISGIFFDSSVGIIEFAKKKSRRIIIPWIIWGGITYFLHILHDNSDFEVGGVGCIKWVLGYGTWLYYVLVLLLCYVIFLIVKRPAFKYILFIPAIITYVLSCYKQLEWLPYSNSQNVFNWIGFFCIGIILKEHKILEKSPKDIISQRTITLLLAITAIIGVIYFKTSYLMEFRPGYWNFFAIPFELTAVIVLYYVSFILKKCKLLLEFGRNSYILFFTHMQLGINIVKILSRNFLFDRSGWINIWSVPAAGFLVILISWFIFAKLTVLIAKKIHCERVLWIIGVQ